MMLSESQERMLMVLKPGAEPIAERVFRKWELDFAVIGRTTDTGKLVVRHRRRRARPISRCRRWRTPHRSMSAPGPRGRSRQPIAAARCAGAEQPRSARWRA